MAPPVDRAILSHEGRSGHDRWHHCKPQVVLQAMGKVGTPEKLGSKSDPAKGGRRGPSEVDRG